MAGKHRKPTGRKTIIDDKPNQVGATHIKLGLNAKGPNLEIGPMTGPRPAGRRWTPSEDIQIRDMLDAWIKAIDIARRKRMPRAIRTRITTTSKSEVRLRGQQTIRIAAAVDRIDRESRDEVLAIPFSSAITGAAPSRCGQGSPYRLRAPRSTARPSPLAVAIAPGTRVSASIDGYATGLIAESTDLRGELEKSLPAQACLGRYPNKLADPGDQQLQDRRVVRLMVSEDQIQGGHFSLHRTSSY
jgi:hypothetical protein